LHTDIGWLLVCSPRDDFPSQTERLILGVAANQAVVGVQQAQLQAQQARVSQELDRKVRQRTKELGTANAELGCALKQIDALRDDLKRENLLLREQAAGARAFRQSTGVPPHRWLLDRRVKRAKELLPNSSLSLSDVALACGFGDQSHFTRTFTAAVRLSPGVWRRLQSAP
jgi:transcriptional regulator GlxA family with amidase domain